MTATPADHSIAAGDVPTTPSRCAWCIGNAAMEHYHDHEWGFADTTDIGLFEKLCLESFQSGLSWRTILDKRPGFRAAFAGFDFQTISQFTQADVERLLADTGIVRHRGKIAATIHNAQCAQEAVAEYGSLLAFFWSYAVPTATATTSLPATTTQSSALSKILKRRGWKFVGPTTVYAFMQSSGMVNDHTAQCLAHWPAEASRQRALAQPR